MVCLPDNNCSSSCHHALCSTGLLSSSATVFSSHTTPAISSSSSQPNSIFLSQYSSSSLPNAVIRMLLYFLNEQEVTVDTRTYCLASVELVATMIYCHSWKMFISSCERHLIEHVQHVGGPKQQAVPTNASTYMLYYVILYSIILRYTMLYLAMLFYSLGIKHYSTPTFYYYKK